MSISGRIAALRQRKERLLARIASDKEFVNKINTDIADLEALEIRALLQETKGTSE